MKRFWRQTILLALLAALIFTSARRTQGQSNALSAPRVISSTPAEREVVGPNAAIQLIFDQAMDRASVEASFVIDPKVDGKFTWTDDSTLVFTPTAPLQRGQTYALTVGMGAKSKSNVALDDPYKLAFVVTGNLAVSQVVPAANAPNVEAGATITVVFNRPVVPLVTTGDQSTLPQPLTLSPAVEGKGEWVGTAIYVFRPSKALAGGTAYTATISGDLKDNDGNPLEKPYTWQFTTVAPQLQTINPNPGLTLVPLDTPISVVFNQPMDSASTQEAFAVRNAANGATVAGIVSFDNNGATLNFKASSPLALGTQYQITVLASAKSASGTATLTNPTTATFMTVPYPAVIDSVPKNGDKVEPGGGMNVIFSAPIDPKSLVDKVHVDPKPDNLSINPGGNTLYINFQSLPATTYTVTLDAGIADPYGNTIKDPVKITFSTMDALPSLGVATRDVFALTSAYRPDTSILAAGVNISQIDARLSALELPELLGILDEYGNFNIYNYSPAHITRSWTQKLQAKPNERAVADLKLAGDNGGKLAPGAYYLDLTAPEISNPQQQPLKRIVVVATAALTFKIGPDEALVWVTDLKSGQPIKGAKVDLYTRTKQSVGSGTTDANGLFRTPTVKDQFAQANQQQPFIAVVTGDGVFSFGSSQWMNNFQPYDFKVQPDFQPRHDVVYLYTDQPVYRPGHPVYFRGIVRNKDDVTFGVPANATAQVTVTDPQGKEISKQQVTLNNYAAFNGKYEPPADAAVGAYGLRVDYNGQQFYLGFQIAEFRPPEFIVNAKADAPEVVAGDTIKVNIDSSFFFGGAVSGANVTWNAIANQGFFNYTGDGNYDFSSVNYYGDDYVYNRQVGSGTGKLDDKGHFVIELPADLAGKTSLQDFTIEATVTDVSNQAISGRTTVRVHPAKVYIGLQPTAYVGQAGKPSEIKIIAVDWASVPQPNQAITLKVAEKRWQQDTTSLQWSQQSIPLTDGKVTTDDKGKATFSFTPPKSGQYEVEATTRDSGERIARTTTNVWVSGPDYVPWNRDNKGVTLIADKKQYAPGDTASILIPSPFPEPVQALITVERAGIMKSEIVTITGSLTYNLPLEVIHAPNVYVAVAIMRGSGDKDVTPELRYGVINLPVSVPQQLKIQITPSTKVAKPGDTVKFDLLITDLTGEPVAAEVGLSLSDLANLSVGTDNSAKIFDFFWSPRGLSILTSSPLSKLIDDLTEKDIQLEIFRAAKAFGILQPAAPPLAKADGANASESATNAPAPAVTDGLRRDKDADQSAQAPAPRTNFVDTPLWKPDLVSGADGRASIDVTLPDNLTTWRLNARAISQKTYVGDATFDIVSTKPLLVRPSTPRFFVVGDESELAVVVNNNSDQDLSVDVSLDAKGVTLKDGAQKQTVSIPKAGRTRVTWLATVMDVENVDLTFTAISGQFSDASKPAVGLGDQRLLPVYRYLAPDYVSTAGVLTQPGSRTEAVLLPNATLAPTGELTLKVQPSLAATTLDGLDYLRNYPYQCIEQTVSKFLPNIITFRALQKLGLDKPELRANLESAVNYAVARLQREQHPDGGWGWFPQDQSNPLTTTYALLGLVEAKASDLPVDNDMLRRAISFLLTTAHPADDNTSFYEMNQIAFTQYVLVRAQTPNMGILDSLYQRREKMHLFARAFLAQAYHEAAGDQQKIDTLLSDLQSAAIVSATGTHWEEKETDWWNWDSNTRTTAIVLKTLVDLTPKSELLPNVVRWLMVARRGDAWETTQETAWAVMALTDWMDTSGELKADYSYTIKLNDKAVGDGKANADTLRDTKTLQISVADMLRDQANRVTFDHGDGPGSLYYTASLHVNQPVELIKPTNRGIGLTRTYTIDNKVVTGAKVGDTINVALEITAASDLYYVNIEDPIPAGAELVDTSLQTTTQIGQTPQLSSIDPYRGGWGWWWFSNTELRTEKIVLSATYLPRGTYRYVYQIRASSAGTYKVIPANGNEFYFPEVFGRGDGTLFTIMP
ncbi:MAG: Ig-like domain-containing protein [Chloroflexota bacterium]